MALATVQVGTPLQLEILRGLLAERGIPAVLVDRDLVPFVGSGKLDATLQVPEERLQDAQDAIAEARPASAEAGGAGSPPEKSRLRRLLIALLSLGGAC